MAIAMAMEMDMDMETGHGDKTCRSRFLRPPYRLSECPSGLAAAVHNNT